MLASTILFYIFSTLATFSGIFLIGSRNAIYSVLFLVLVFFNISGLLLLLEIEFLALLFLVVYVGAIAVLFLFVVMMLNIRAQDTSVSVFHLLPIGSFLGFVFLVETFLIFQNCWVLPVKSTDPGISSFVKFYVTVVFFDWWNMFKYSFVSNIKTLGLILYTDCVLFFLLSGLLLLLALLGSIMLTMKNQKGLMRQDIYQQISRDAKHAVFIVDFYQ